MPAACHTSEHLRAKAKRFLPRMVFDYVEGGAGGEDTLGRNRRALDAVRLLPEALNNCTSCTMQRTLFGVTYAAPFGVAPVGLANLVRAGTDEALARAAWKAQIPYALSTAGTTSIETIAKAVPGHAWFQLYVGEDPAITDDLIARAERAGITVLLVTVDVPAPGKRVRDLVNGLTLPLRPSPAVIADTAFRPRWLLQMLTGGVPKLETIAPYFKDEREKPHASQIARRVSSPRFDWAELERIRKRWRGTLVVKGVLNPADAVRAADLGAEGVVVSNHGGRQLDAAPASIEMLPRVRDAVGDRLKVLFDSGVRSGDDIARALALGADFVLIGRPFLYSIAALGAERGPERLIGILSAELENTMIHMGCSAVDQIARSHIWSA
ncbi:alpha-hydroxy acid oxidase [Microvirga pudoricolor]|uniref:alpha-hydroxy acid oxidase n=1 Tax=Microvirga pudoricolor TaxID=2778729 RepID=UPI00194E5A20|nr:alpha-hydroxy acid oxidase [Microvirga pudoricolor]MBM6594868.1 alpha-hydroxy-acid oxidizing protein [Microvirga pudoricolor]